jgi:hypothetical protein
VVVDRDMQILDLEYGDLERGRGRGGGGRSHGTSVITLRP